MNRKRRGMTPDDPKSVSLNVSFHKEQEYNG